MGAKVSNLFLTPVAQRAEENAKIAAFRPVGGVETVISASLPVILVRCVRLLCLTFAVGKKLLEVMLRKIRLTLAILFFVGITLLFLDFTGTVHAWLGWMAKIQFLPALLAVNAGVVVMLVLLTLVCGRVYCSVICPLGVMQDAVAWLGKKRRKNRYTYSPALSWLRYGVLAVFIVALVAGVG